MNHPVIIVVMVALAVFPVPLPAHTFEERWEPVKSMPPMIDRSPRPLTFEERWEPVRRLPPMLRINDVGPRVIPVSEPRKLDRLIPLPDPVPEIRVKTIKFGPLGEANVDKLEPAAEDSPPPLPRPRHGVAPHPVAPPARARVIRTAGLDICQRHGMHKQVTRGGKSWRCRK